MIYKDRCAELSANVPGTTGTVTVNLSGQGHDGNRAFSAAGYANNDMVVAHVYQAGAPQVWCVAPVTYRTGPARIEYAVANILDGIAGAGVSPAWSSHVVISVEPTSWLTRHEALTGLSADDHPQYHNNARGDARYAPVAHVTSTADHAGLVAAQTAASASKTTPVNADEVPLLDSQASGVLRRLSWANLWAGVRDALAAAGRLLPTGTLGQMVRHDGTQWAATSNLFWDEANRRLGVNTASPTSRIDVRGDALADVIATEVGINIRPVTSPGSPAVALVSTPGNIDNGTQWYFVTYVTALGETGVVPTTPISITIADRLVAGQVNVTLPVSTDPRVTGRRVYRSGAAGNQWTARLLATIHNNTDTSFVDNLADTALATPNSYWRENTTSRQIQLNGLPAMFVGSGIEASVCLGRNAGTTLANGTATGGSCVFVGDVAGQSVTTGSKNTGVGFAALRDVSTGVSNTALGWGAWQFLTIGSHNIAMGDQAGRFNVTGSHNTCLGTSAGQGVSGNSYTENVFVGRSAGLTVTTGSRNTFLGSFNGDTVTTGNNNLLLGYNLDLPAATTSNFMSVGNLLFSEGINGTGATASTGNLGVGIATPTARLDVNGDTLRLRTARTPASATAAGNPGDICWDATHIYICIATNTWRRAAHATW